jgi:voltage-gated potassium channel
LWILKITRYLPAMGALGRVLKRERRTLAAVMSIMVIMLFIASSLIYLLEHEQQPEQFGSIPHAMWWGIATLTTVGYGDVVPVSTMGKALGSVIMLLGIGTFALPAGVLASAFAEERKRQDFIVTWNLVAQVPFFAFLTARDIAGIAALLHPREVAAHEIVLHKGEDADSMFFIVSGELEAELQPEPIRLVEGDFFGEVALIFHRQRTATVVAMTRCELLELDAQDLHQLFERKPQLKVRIMEAAEKRLARSQSAEAAASEQEPSSS